MKIFFVISKRVTKNLGSFLDFIASLIIEKTCKIVEDSFSLEEIALDLTPYTLSNYINIHTNDCIHIQYISVIAHASNEYVYMYDFIRLYQLLHTHSMAMCIRMIAHICIDCFANASNAYVYMYDCTHSYQLFCICIQCICVYI
jgi:hypothetical protein